MNRLRNMRGLVRILLAVLVAAQIAGVLSLPLAKAAPGPSGVGSQVHHQHAHGGAGTAGHHQTDQKSSFTEHCCALHAIFVGTVCQTVGLEASAASCTRVVPANDLGQHAKAASRLDRPPRTIV